MSQVYATLTSGRIANGFDGKPAININEARTAASFSVSVPKYDKDADKNTRWENFKVVCFGNLINRVEKMQLKSGSWVSVNGSLNMESYTSNDGVKHTYWQITATDIDFAGTGSGKKSDTENTAAPETATVSAASGGYESYMDGEDLPF